MVYVCRYQGVRPFSVKLLTQESQNGHFLFISELPALDHLYVASGNVVNERYLYEAIGLCSPSLSTLPPRLKCHLISYAEN